MSFNCSTHIDRHPMQRRNKRKGLAPVELVISVPLLMMLMALMVTFGTAACWKIRTEVVSRDAAWRTRWPRGNYMAPRPQVWPDSAGMSALIGDSVDSLDDPSIQHPVVRGPLGSVSVNDELLDFSRDVRLGYSRVQRNPAMLKKLDTIEFQVGSPIVDDKFQFGQMGLAHNSLRRMPLIYEMPESPGQSANYEASLSAIQNSFMQNAWQVLDNDDELNAFYGRVDFHPRLGSFCETDPESVRGRQLAMLLPRIGQVPSNMTRTFIRMYESQLREDPPPSFLLQAQIGAKLEQLHEFEEELNNGGGTGGMP